MVGIVASPDTFPLPHLYPSLTVNGQMPKASPQQGLSDRDPFPVQRDKYALENMEYWNCFSRFKVLFRNQQVPKKASHSKAKPVATPRYLLKLQTEVDAMMQLGASLDSVYLKV